MYNQQFKQKHEQKFYEECGNLVVVCQLVNDDNDSTDWTSKTIQQNRNMYKIQIEQCCPDKENYEYYFELKSINFNYPQSSTTGSYNKSEVTTESQYSIVGGSPVAALLKGYIQIENIQQLNSYYINTVLDVNNWPSNKVFGNYTTNIPNGYANLNIPIQANIVARYGLKYNDIYSGYGYSSTEVDVQYSCKFKVDGMTLIFKLSTDDITGNSKIPINLQQIGRNSGYFYNNNFNVIFQIYRVYKN